MPSSVWMAGSVAMMLCASVVLMAAAPHSLGFSSSNTDLAQTLAAFVGALREGRLEAALAQCAAGDAGLRAVQAEDQRVYRSEASETNRLASSDRFQIEFLDTLADLYADLARAGLDWTRARAVAFVGAGAYARHPELMRRSVRVATGEVYIACGDRLYAVEVSARRPDGRYYISDIWAWRSVGPLPADTRSLAETRFREFDQEDAASHTGVRLSRIRRIFIPF